MNSEQVKRVIADRDYLQKMALRAIMQFNLPAVKGYEYDELEEALVNEVVRAFGDLDETELQSDEVALLLELLENTIIANNQDGGGGAAVATLSNIYVSVADVAHLLFGSSDFVHVLAAVILFCAHFELKDTAWIHHYGQKKLAQKKLKRYLDKRFQVAEKIVETEEQLLDQAAKQVKKSKSKKKKSEKEILEQVRQLLLAENDDSDED